MTRRKHHPGNIFIPPRPEDFIPEHPPSGICLLCDQWLGVNCDEHEDHKHETPSEKPSSPSHVDTPHIVFTHDLNPSKFSDDEDEEEPEEEVKQKEAEDTKEEKEEEVKQDTDSPKSPKSEFSFLLQDGESQDNCSYEANSVPIADEDAFDDPPDYPGDQVDSPGLAYSQGNSHQKGNLMNELHRSASKQMQSPRINGAKEALMLCLSALYGKLLVVMGLAFPIAESLSNDLTFAFYNGFYLFLYSGSIIFLIYAYLFLLRSKSIPTAGIKHKIQSFKHSMTNLDLKVPSEVPFSDKFKNFMNKRKNGEEKNIDAISTSASVYKPPKYTITESSNHGSMYLKMGAVAFGIGSMIYSGLEFGQYFDLDPDSGCGSITQAATPIARMIFTFLQMYFIFLNSRVAISRHGNIARFGLMHMIATNLCIWQNVLVQETKHEIRHLEHTMNKSKNHAELIPDFTLGNDPVLNIAKIIESTETKYPHQANFDHHKENHESQGHKTHLPLVHSKKPILRHEKPHTSESIPHTQRKKLKAHPNEKNSESQTHRKKKSKAHPNYRRNSKKKESSTEHYTSHNNIHKSTSPRQSSSFTKPNNKEHKSSRTRSTEPYTSKLVDNHKPTTVSHQKIHSNPPFSRNPGPIDHPLQDDPTKSQPLSENAATTKYVSSSNKSHLSETESNHPKLTTPSFLVNPPIQKEKQSTSKEDIKIDHDNSPFIDTSYRARRDAAFLDQKIVKRSVTDYEDLHDEYEECRRTNLMGNVVNRASPFLFPCTIEYSLLCAGVLYVMWKNINVAKSERSTGDGDSDISNFIARKVRHHYSVDCARASRGLFIGIFVLVLTIISLILFYVLISNEQYKKIAILEANIIEVSIYSMAIVSIMIGMRQMRELDFIPEGEIELDNILLLIAQGGVYIYSSFTIIGGGFSSKESPILPLVTSVLTLVQTTMQTIFILDGCRRCCQTADQHERKPGREMVTFLLVCNLAMWAISTFETSRADVHPVQLEFYGIWAWTIISHISMPLAIFYRFHVTVCLGEIWKRSYKMKNEIF